MTTGITWHDVKNEYPKAQSEGEYWDGLIVVLATVCHKAEVRTYFAYSGGFTEEYDISKLNRWQVKLLETHDTIPMWKFIDFAPEQDVDFKEDDEVIGWAYLPTYSEKAKIAQEFGYDVPIFD